MTSTIIAEEINDQTLGNNEGLVNLYDLTLGGTTYYFHGEDTNGALYFKEKSWNFCLNFSILSSIGKLSFIFFCNDINDSFNVFPCEKKLFSFTTKHGDSVKSDCRIKP